MQHSFNQEELSNNSLNKCYSNSKYRASIDINNETLTSGSSTKLLTPKQLTFDDSYLVIIYNNYKGKKIKYFYFKNPMTPSNRKILLNPISSIKRNMFINSKQYPNTTYYSAHVDLNDDDQTQTSMF
jgi:hypothetical protein